MSFTYEALWSLLKQKNLSIEDLASATGIDKDELLKLKNGTIASKNLIKKLCDYLQCDIAEIVDRGVVDFSISIPSEVSDGAIADIIVALHKALRVKIAAENGRINLQDLKADDKRLTLDGHIFQEDINDIQSLIKDLTITALPALSDKISVSCEAGDAAQLLPQTNDQPKEEKKEEGGGLDWSKMIGAFTDREQKMQEKSDESKKTAPERKPAKREGYGIKKKKQIEKKNASAIKELQKELAGFVGAKDFLSLCNEIISIADQFPSEKDQSIFTSQAYLFSIANGEGLSTALSTLGKVVDKCGIVKVDYQNAKEIAVPFKNIRADHLGEALSDVYDHAFSGFLRSRSYKDDGIGVVCLDISEWIDHIGSADFKDFLRKVVLKQNDCLVVFRIPFVDKEVQRKVREALNDAFYVRIVSFAPLSKEDYRKLAKMEIEKYGYQMDAGAWKYLEKRLSEEKSDGTFYGIKTLKKVVFELLYKKKVAGAGQKTASKRISAKDAKALTYSAPEDDMSAAEMLNSLVGMESVKAQLNEILTQIEFSRTLKNISTPTIHMRFVGNPGTGKTTVARILGKILKEKGILRVGNFYEYSGRDFCGRYVGETAPKTTMMCRDAYGSVLFIDEAYSLYRDDAHSSDYGREALDTLIAEMENHRDDLLVIMAGYTDEMDTLMRGNSGLKSRMPYTITFNNFNRKELYLIFASLVKKNFCYEEEVLTEAEAYFNGLSDAFITAKDFSNGRFVRNLFERTWAKAAMRRELENGKLKIIKEDFLRSVSDEDFKKDLTVTTRKSKRIGFGSGE